MICVLGVPSVNVVQRGTRRNKVGMNNVRRGLNSKNRSEKGGNAGRMPRFLIVPYDDRPESNNPDKWSEAAVYVGITTRTVRSRTTGRIQRIGSFCTPSV